MSRASQVHHVPQVGLPQIDPVASVSPTKQTASSPPAAATRSQAARRVHR